MTRLLLIVVVVLRRLHGLCAVPYRLLRRRRQLDRCDHLARAAISLIIRLGQGYLVANRLLLPDAANIPPGADRFQASRFWRTAAEFCFAGRSSGCGTRMIARGRFSATTRIRIRRSDRAWHAG